MPWQFQKHLQLCLPSNSMVFTAVVFGQWLIAKEISLELALSVEIPAAQNDPFVNISIITLKKMYNLYVASK